MNSFDVFVIKVFTVSLCKKSDLQLQMYAAEAQQNYVSKIPLNVYFFVIKNGRQRVSIYVGPLPRKVSLYSSWVLPSG